MTAIDLRREFDSLVATERTYSSRSIACWGSAGSGKSVIALNLAFEIAAAGFRVCLVDADTYHPSLAALLGITSPTGGITALLRLARQDRLSREEFDRLSHRVEFSGGNLSVVSGLTAPGRWAEVDPEGLELLTKYLSGSFDFLVWDMASFLQTGLIDSVTGKDRNQASNHILSNSDIILASFLADPVGVNRFLFDMREVGGKVWPIANRVRQSVLGRNPVGQLQSVLAKTAGLTLRGEIWEDQGFDHLLQTTRPLCLQGKSSKAQQTLRNLAVQIIKELER